MIFELLFLVFVIIYCIKASPLNILLLIIVLLPIHGTIKYLVFSQGGEFYSSWKEVAILILFVKTSSLTLIKPLKSYFVLYCLFFVLVIFYLIIGLEYGLPIMSRLKQLLFPSLILFSISKLKLTFNDVRKIIFFAGVGSIAINLTGLVDFLSPSVRILFRDLMRVGYVYDSMGNIYYDVSSFKIMGFDRVCGLMAGGPNQMGVYNAFVCFVCVIYWMFLKVKDRRLNLFWGVITLLSAFCLLTSFSRAGMAILTISLFFYALRLQTKHAIMFAYITVSLLALVLVFSMIYPQISEILMGTLTGKEASSAARGTMTLDALEFLFEHPFGFGIGASSYAHTNMNKYAIFAESSFINIAIDIGILGLLILTVMYYKCYKAIHYRKNFLMYLGSYYLIANYIVSFVSVNPYENPYIYLSWIVFALSTAYIVTGEPSRKKIA